MENKIILIEGEDGSGKSTLANRIMAKYPNHVYIHNAVTNDIHELHRNTIEAAEEAVKQHMVIIDRLHISEYVYGTIYRNGPSYDIKAFDDYLNKSPNIIKIFCHVDKEQAVNVHASRKDIEMFDSNDKVWDMYDKACDNTWLKYNWKTDTLDLDTFTVSKKA